MSKLSIAILFGGKSVEHNISINSARNIYEYIDKEKYDPILIGISPKGDWHLMDSVNGDFQNKPLLALRLSTGDRGFINLENQQTISPDLIFPVLHGTDGEDGSIQGMLESMEIPFAGTGVLGSAVSMSKLYTKKLLQGAGIPTSRFVDYTYDDRNVLSFQKVKEAVGLPFMAKAANLGSSVGVSKVNNETDFNKAVEEAFKFDDLILFEEFVSGRELECSVMGNHDAGASMPAEIVISDQYEFYSYEAKYLDPNAVELKIPAEIPAETAEKIRALSIRAYKALNCKDFARVDLFLKPNGEILINEINTIPGFTNSSMFPMMWKEQGISFTALITKLIEMASKSHEDSKRASQHYRP